MKEDLAQIPDYQVLRLYGVDGNQVANLLAAAPANVQIFTGLFNLGTLAADLQSLVQQVGNSWSRINSVSVGNELVNNGEATVQQITDAIQTTRSTLRAQGYTGPVVTVDTMVAMKNNMDLCHASDYCAINCHAFFDGGVEASGAGDFVKGWVDQIAALSGGKEVVVTESGWPSSGQTNGKAIPSPEAQAAALNSLKSTFATNLVLYTAFNNLWQKDTALTFGTEKFWGINGNAPSSH
jgi:exo-beta-1,3-glucanase (GH17 family)